MRSRIVALGLASSLFIAPAQAQTADSWIVTGDYTSCQLTDNFMFALTWDQRRGMQAHFTSSGLGRHTDYMGSQPIKIVFDDGDDDPNDDGEPNEWEAPGNVNDARRIGDGTVTVPVGLEFVREFATQRHMTVFVQGDSVATMWLTGTSDAVRRFEQCRSRVFEAERRARGYRRF